MPFSIIHPFVFRGTLSQNDGGLKVLSGWIPTPLYHNLRTFLKSVRQQTIIHHGQALLLPPHLEAALPALSFNSCSLSADTNPPGLQAAELRLDLFNGVVVDQSLTGRAGDKVPHGENNKQCGKKKFLGC